LIKFADLFTQTRRINKQRIENFRNPFDKWKLDRKKTQNSAQIDLLIDADDNVINICEMKFYNTEFAIDKKYAAEIAKKSILFAQVLKLKKAYLSLL
jgi:hypothetical protein